MYIANRLRIRALRMFWGFVLRTSRILEALWLRLPRRYNSVFKGKEGSIIMTYGRYTTALALFSSVLFVACIGEEPYGDELEQEPESLGTVVQELCVTNGNLGSACGSVISGSTKTKGNDLNPSCAYSLAEDVAYTWTAPFTGSYTFSTAGSQFDTVLSLLTSACGSTIACNDDANGTYQSQFTVGLTAGQQYVIVVDGYGTSAGNFSLSITCPSGCTINGQPYQNGQVNPSNPCQYCNVALSTNSWSNNDGHWISGGGWGYCKYNVCIGCPGTSYCSTHDSGCDGICQGGVIVTDCLGGMEP